MRCPSCGSEVISGHRVCGVCGTPAAAEEWQPARPLTGRETGWTTIAAAPRRATPPLVVWPALAIGLVAFALFVSTVGVSLARERPSGEPVRTSTFGPTTDGTRGSEERAEDQAEAVDRLLEWSSASRAKLTAPLGQLDDCRGVASALGVLREVTDERKRQRDAAEELSVDLVDGGAEARAYLVDALDYSYDADLAYLEWGTYLRDNGCRGPGSELRHWDSVAVAADRSAAKKRFIDHWNPIAGRYGLRRWAASEI